MKVGIRTAAIPESSESQQLLLESVHRLAGARFTREVLRAASRGEWLHEEWQAFEELGVPMALVSEANGGFGLPVQEALSVITALAQALKLNLATSTATRGEYTEGKTAFVERISAISGQQRICDEQD